MDEYIKSISGKKFWINAKPEGVVKVINDRDFKPTTDTLKKWLPQFEEIYSMFYPLETSGGYRKEPFPNEEWIAFRYIHTNRDNHNKVNPLKTYYAPDSWFRDNAKII
ncbi:hypothetical protein V7112_08580 [Bacillus sp. JJ1566]|uniref:hypothetical protein n=1 Tax=Bacillus sp. JJ1566 TaxID=3122961 RepID=UPI002FFF4EA1